MTAINRIMNRAYTTVDYPRVIEFLGELLKSSPNRHNWLPGRFEYAEYLVSPLFQQQGKSDWKETIHLWFEDEALVAMVNSENPDANTYVQIRPGFEWLTEDMIGWAEEHLAVADWDNTQPRLAIWAHENDSERQTILKAKGFSLTDNVDYLQRQVISDDFIAPELPEGYFLSSFAEGLDYNSRMRTTARAFGDDTPLSESVYQVVRMAPNYRPELDMAIVDSRQDVIAVATFWIDEANQLGYIEPVATNPDYHGKGFGKLLLNQGLFKLKQLGIHHAYVGAHAGVRPFYKSCGFIEAEMNQMWEKWYPLTQSRA